MPALYRIHRPQTWEALTGQDTVRDTLKQEIRTGRIAHAYLFSGPRGVGKTTSARLLAKALNCTARAQDSAEPCNSCESCTAITSSKAIDLIELDAATHTGVDAVREHIIENAQARPMQLQKKIFIIDEVHRLSGSAFDALLKTLEEPPEHAFFILATTEAHKLPATILSRCQRFTFTHIAPQLMKSRLQELLKKESVTVESEILDRVIARSGGCMRDAESLLDQILSLGDNISLEQAQSILPPTQTSHAYPFIESLFQGNTEECLKQLQELLQKGVSMEAFTKALIEVLRAMLVSSVAPSISFAYLEGFAQNKDKLASQALELSEKQQQAILYYFTEALTMLKRSSIPQLPLELAVISAARAIGKPKTSQVRSSTQAVDATPQEATPPTQAQPAPTEQKQPIVDQTPTQHEAPEKSTTIATIEEGEIQNIWNQLKKQALQKAPSLSIMFTSAKAQSAQQGKFQISVGFPFHQDKLMEPDNKNLIESLISDITGKQFSLEVSVVEQAADPAEESTPLAQEVANAFGGEIIH